MTDKLLTPKEAAAYCRVSVSWLANMRMNGGGPDFIKIGMKISYGQSDLDAWLAAHKVVRHPRSCRSETAGGPATSNSALG